MAEQSSQDGPDFTEGFPLAEIPDGGTVSGHVGGEPALLARQGGEVFAIGATCTHYGAPLADGLVVGGTIRCPWHHACFSLRTGAVLRAPALSGVKCWRVEQSEGRAVAREAVTPAQPEASGARHPESIVIVGGGAAGHSAAITLRREGYRGKVTILGADPAPPYDRPNLSKDYLAGTADPEWLPLAPAEFYAEQRIDLCCGSRVTGLDPEKKTVTLAEGGTIAYGALLLATGADPVRPPIPGAELAHVHVLRTLADSNALIARLGAARNCVVIGAGFIGLEVAAALRTRGLDVAVVAPESLPLERVLGAELGDMLKTLHESRGVAFHLGVTVARIEAGRVTLSSGDALAADLVILGTGVRPDLTLARAAGVAVDRGIAVDAFLRTSVPDILAAGDIARWPDARTGEAIRVEHWVVAQRMGATAARNMLGRAERFAAVPFFWSQHYDIAVNYVGHAESWDRIEIDGNPAAHDCTATWWREGRRLAVATVGRDLDSLRAEAAFELEGKG